LHDGRPACRAEADVHRLAGLSCIDCHLHTDLMGDDREWEHSESQVEITCEACHGPRREGSEGTETTWSEVRDPISRDLLRQRGETRPADERVRLGRRGTPLWNLRPSGSGWVTLRKGQGVALATRQTPTDPNHVLRGHERLTCSACHAAWAPTCSTCHTSFDPDGKQWDFAKAAETAGRWVETSHGYAARPPALAVRPDGRIAPAIPGMVMELDATAAGGPRASRRFYASLDPHSTGKKARDCASCHLSSWALGLGTGTLALSGPAPDFMPATPAPEDIRMASDAWTRLDATAPGVGTRVGLRSLNATELRRALVVGACLPCHKEVRDPVWRDFEESVTRLTRGGTPCTFRPPGWIPASG
ncbi:MAG TPA: hypothetical protein VE129_00365, partial [Thermoanaerobaculia bacterium]|nr:hypothetical protein [Thermoanaerobaculia bacterium]